MVFCHTLTWIGHGCTYVIPSWNPPSTSLPTPSLWVVSEHRLWVPCFMHLTWTGHLFLIWWYTCFNSILSNHPTLAFSHRVQKSSGNTPTQSNLHTHTRTCIYISSTQGFQNYMESKILKKFSNSRNLIIFTLIRNTY